MEIKVYTSPTCSWCKQLKDWLKSKKLSFQEINVLDNDKYRDELIAKSRQMAVPVVEIDGTVIVGFNKEKMEEILRKAGKKI